MKIDISESIGEHPFIWIFIASMALTAAISVTSWYNPKPVDEPYSLLAPFLIFAMLLFPTADLIGNDLKFSSNSQ